MFLSYDLIAYIIIKEGQRKLANLIIYIMYLLNINV